jgi:hypothetical protein
VKSLNSKIEEYKQTEKVRLKSSRIEVAGGDCVFTGSSAASRRSKTVLEIYMDEAALFQAGSVIELEGRTKASEKFGRKVFAMSSRREKGDEIDKAHKACETFYEWHTFCPHCNHNWLAGSKHLKWPTRNDYAKEHGIADPETVDYAAYKGYALRDVYLKCPECGYKMRSAEKDERILSGKYQWVHVAGPKDGRTVGVKGNALAMYFTSFETIAELVINAENDGTFDDMAQIFLDYFDEIYEPEIKEANKSEILTLGNGLAEKIVPEDTYRLYLTIDTQKDGFWFQITAAEYGYRLNTVLHGFVESFEELELLIGYKFKTPSGKTRAVDKVMIDRMGIKERTAEVDAWVEYLVVQQGLEGMVYPTIGIDADPSGRLWFKTTLVKDVTTQEARKTPIEAVKLNNLLLKNELQGLVARSIKRARGEEGFKDSKTRMFFVNETIVDTGNDPEHVSVSTDYERQMTSEIYGFHINQKTGKLRTTQTWDKRTKNADNHLWDCSVQAVACALMDSITLAQKPTQTQFMDALVAMGL